MSAIDSSSVSDDSSYDWDGLDGLRLADYFDWSCTTYDFSTDQMKERVIETIELHIKRILFPNEGDEDNYNYLLQQHRAQLFGSSTQEILLRENPHFFSLPSDELNPELLNVIKKIAVSIADRFFNLQNVDPFGWSSPTSPTTATQSNLEATNSFLIGLEFLNNALMNPLIRHPMQDVSQEISDFLHIYNNIHDCLIAAKILEKQEEIQQQKEYWKEKIAANSSIMDPNNRSKGIEEALEKGELVRIDEGAGAAYFLYDENGNITYVVKPVDEDICTLNNAKYFIGYENGYLVRDNIPVYRSAQTDVICYQVAEIIGVTEITPPTIMMVGKDSHFNVNSELFNKELAERIEIADSNQSESDGEKLFSAQEYVPNAKQLYEIHFQGNAVIDQRDFELANIFIWTTYNTDGHSGNILVHREDDNSDYGLKVIDNGLSFPETNEWLRNALAYMPNAEQPLSEEAKNIILQIDEEKIIDLLHFYEMEECVDAFKERIAFLKELTQENLTISEINRKMGDMHV